MERRYVISVVDEAMALNKSQLGKYLALLGIIIMVIGAILFLLMFTNLIGGSLKNPKTEAKYTVITPKEVYIAPGDYEVWYEEDLLAPYDFKVIDENGHDVFTKETSKLTLYDCKKAGTIKVSEGGMFNITTNRPVTLYITEPITTAAILMPLASGFAGGCMLSIGSVIIIVSLILYFIGKNEDKARNSPPQYPQYAQYPPEYYQGQQWEGGPPPNMPPPPQ